MDHAQFTAFLGRFKAAIDKGELPELVTLEEDEKRALRLFIPLIRDEGDVKSIARFLPHINTPEKVAALAFVIKLGAAGILLVKASRLLMTWPGLAAIVFLAWLFGGDETREIVRQIVEIVK